MAFEKGKGKEHLDKEFLDELKHKIWSTKGSRFNADQRLRTIAKYSSFGNSFLSGYLIIFGLLSVYNLSNSSPGRENFTAFSITGLSILSLIFSVVENSSNYLLRAKGFHDCALELAVLYNEIQIFKTHKTDVSAYEKLSFVSDIQKRYQLVLEKYENHAKIDNKMFRAQHRDYYPVKWNQALWYNLQYFFYTKFSYLLMIFGPILIIVVLLIK